MTPDQLAGWEAVLRSQVAVSLLLLGALIVALRQNNAHRAEIRELNGWIREHLQAEGDFTVTLDKVRAAIQLATPDYHPRGEGHDAALSGTGGSALRQDLDS